MFIKHDKFEVSCNMFIKLNLCMCDLLYVRHYCFVLVLLSDLPVCMSHGSSSVPIHKGQNCKLAHYCWLYTVDCPYSQPLFHYYIAFCLHGMKFLDTYTITDKKDNTVE